MSGKTDTELTTPEDRLPAIATRLGVANFDKLQPYVKRAILLARIDEARKKHSEAVTARVRELAKQLHECEKEIPKEHRL